MSSNKKSIGPFKYTYDYDEHETDRGIPRSSRPGLGEIDSSLMGRRHDAASASDATASPGSRSMQEYTLSPAYKYPQLNGYASATNQNTLSRRQRSSRAGSHTASARYESCRAGVGVDQINGVVIVCGGEAVDHGIEAPTGKFQYRDCAKEGSGVQVNGLEIIYYGPSTVPTHPGMNGDWQRMTMVSAEGADLRGPKNQINGGRIRHVGRNDEEMARYRSYLR